MPASSRTVMVPSGNPLQSTRSAMHIQTRRRSARELPLRPATGTPARRSSPSSAAGPRPPGTLGPGKEGKSREEGSRRAFPCLPVEHTAVAPRNDFSPECGFGLAVAAASCNHLQPLECTGEIGEIYLFIVVICRQWVFLMRNICFCVFPENIIPL